MRIEAHALRKVFNRRLIFRDVSFVLDTRQVLLVSGRNGAGKSTLVKIIASVLSPSSGSMTYTMEGKALGDQATGQIGLVAPYLQLYDEFSAAEHLSLCMTMRGARPDPDRAGQLLTEVGLFERRYDPVRTYSSGMKQRLKYAAARIHRPAILILDEPMSNLDVEGIAMVRTVMTEHRREGILIVATNDLTDLDHFDTRVDLNVAS